MFSFEKTTHLNNIFNFLDLYTWFILTLLSLSSDLSLRFETLIEKSTVVDFKGKSIR